jgi:PPOX class probable F420-dependent enzyme
MSVPPSLRGPVTAAPVARLATVDADGRQHLVPCCFALDGEVAYSVVDHKPKRTVALRRLDNIAANPAVCLLVDHYEDDWSQLWWVRFDGAARVVTDGPEHERAISVLMAKYPQYRATPPSGAVVAIDIGTTRGWSGSAAPSGVPA